MLQTRDLPHAKRAFQATVGHEVVGYLSSILRFIFQRVSDVICKLLSFFKRCWYSVPQFVFLNKELLFWS